MSDAKIKEELAYRVARDRKNAVEVSRLAEESIRSKGKMERYDPDNDGDIEVFARIRNIRLRDIVSLQAIVNSSFHAMVEVIPETETSVSTGSKEVWYANKDSSINQVLGVPVLSWTHPGIQVALSAGIGESTSNAFDGLTLLNVIPVARAKFDQVRPEISGIYEPGGGVNTRTKAGPKAGLKAVKLDMSKDQVRAFIARMVGMMIITGAPGSGKTTVAVQRIRFLFDQQELRTDPKSISFKPELTKIFLANKNLEKHARILLEKELQVPPEFKVITGVDSFIDDYLKKTWPVGFRNRATQVRVANKNSQDVAREAIVGLADAEDLRGLWVVHEKQVISRLVNVEESEWCKNISRNIVATLAGSIGSGFSDVKLSDEPNNSRISMDRLFRAVRREYEHVRSSLRKISEEELDSFDREFQKWLYKVYDPISTLNAYFESQSDVILDRLEKSTGGTANVERALKMALLEWDNGKYRTEDRSWIAWLMRFTLPRTIDSEHKFQNIPSAIALSFSEGVQWSHVVVDEAQDLSVAEASLLGSLVSPDGALTVSLDFKQIVSPLKGMQDTKAFHVGKSIKDDREAQNYPFARNFRQSREIGEFLQEFYRIAFKEPPSFEVNPVIQTVKPQLIIADAHQFARRIRQIATVFSRSENIESVALLQVNEDIKHMNELREGLEDLGVPLAEDNEGYSNNVLVTSTVENIKGLEFDACILLGLEDITPSARSFTKNRAYVGLSRPAQRLIMICQEYPTVLRDMDQSLFETIEG